MSNQNIYDDETFFKEYKTLRETDNNYNILLEQPAIHKLLPDIRGKSVLDLGCGCGHNCIEFAKMGASEVVGVDISKKMLDVAMAESSGDTIRYINMSMTELRDLNQKFDFVYSSLAFHYVKDFDVLMTDIYSLLNENGCLLFSQQHPIVTATVGGNGHYNCDENNNRVSYTFSNYAEPGERKITWYVDGVIEYHRTFGNIINSIANAGFIIDAMDEPLPDEYALSKRPKLIAEFIKPTFLIIRAKKG